MARLTASSTTHSDELDNASDLKSFLEKFASIIKVTKNRKQKLWRGDDLDKVDIFNGANFWSSLTDLSLANISAELAQELLIWLDRSSSYADEQFPPDFLDHLDIAVDGGAFTQNVDLAWTHHMVRSGKAVACIGIDTIGVHKTVSKVADNSAVDIHWVNDESSNLGFWRNAVDVRLPTSERASAFRQFIVDKRLRASSIEPPELRMIRLAARRVLLGALAHRPVQQASLSSVCRRVIVTSSSLRKVHKGLNVCLRMNSGR